MSEEWKIYYDRRDEDERYSDENKDGFSSPEEAALDFSRRYNSNSIKMNLELASIIYKDGGDLRGVSE